MDASVLKRRTIKDGMSGSCKAAAFPSEIVHIQQFPRSWDEQDLEQVFSNYGSVAACCIHCNYPEYGRTEALVRMNSVASASRAIFALDAHTLTDTVGAALGQLMHTHFFQGMHADAGLEASNEQVTSSDSRGRSEASNLQRLDTSSLPNTLVGSPTSGQAMAKADQSMPRHGSWDSKTMLPASSLPVVGDMNYWEAEAAHPRTSTSRSSSKTALPTPTLGSTPGTQHPSSKSIYVSNLPPEADMLWVYERFAPYGGVLSVKVLQEQRSGKCSGVCFVNYMDPTGAASAIQSLDGIRIAGRSLQVKLQDSRR